MIKPWIPHKYAMQIVLFVNVSWWFKLIFIVTIFNASVHSRGKRYHIHDFWDHTTGAKSHALEVRHTCCMRVSHMKDNDLLSLSFWEWLVNYNVFQFELQYFQFQFNFEFWNFNWAAIPFWNWIDPTLHAITWHLTGDKPLLEPMVTKFYRYMVVSPGLSKLRYLLSLQMKNDS